MLVAAAWKKVGEVWRWNAATRWLAMGMLGTGIMCTWSVAVLSIFLCICNVRGQIVHSSGAPLNIDCGATGSYIDSITGLTWEIDAPYITTGKTATVVPSASSWVQNFPEAKSLRYFNDTRRKNCYKLPVVSNTEYLLKAIFYYGNYDNAANPPSFQLALDGLIVDDVSTASDDGQYYTELLYVSKGTSTSFCLVRTSPQSTPFVSAISLIASGKLTSVYVNQYKSYIVDGHVIRTIKRVNMGATTIVRYPQDPWDRMWFPHSKFPNLLLSTTTIETLTSTLTQVDAWDAPKVLWQTAVSTSTDLLISLMPVGWNGTLDIGYFSSYYAEIAPTIVPRSFIIQPAFSQMSTRVSWNGSITDYNGSDLYGGPVTPATCNVAMSNTGTTVRGPILSGFSFFTIRSQKLSRTNDQDAVAIDKIISSFNLTEWTGDPCLPTPHDWVTCSPSDTGGWTQPQVTALNLSRYNLVGNIPPALGDLVALTSLKLDNNKLTGGLPYLSSITNLEVLNLDNNNLSGELPTWLGEFRKLQELTLQNNNFSGTIPAFNHYIPKFIFKPGNPQLIDNVSNIKPGPTPNKGVIAGAIVGGVVGVALIVLIVFVIIRRKSHNSTNTNAAAREFVGGAKVFTHAEVSFATKKFQTEIGKGGFGPVYYGKLRDGQEVAVKVCKESQGTGEFFNEVEVLSKLRHKNLVTLIGYCQEVEQILIYEFMENGSLHDHLFGNSKYTAGNLDWTTRLNIALDAAQGLAYLHTGCGESIVHRDIKSTNILLTAKFGAKVADFGVTKLIGDDSKVFTLVKGTAGYLDPEYYTTHFLTLKSDIFSFGVVLLELLTGRACIDRSNPSNMHPNICDWVRKTLKHGDVREVLDPAMTKSVPGPSLEAAWKVAEIAMQCVEPRSIHRPTILRVVEELHLALKVEEQNSSSEYSIKHSFSVVASGR